MSIRVISKELQKIAEDELFEVPERIQEDLRHIREWITKQPHLNARTDDQWLLTFLRGCKFSLERTKEKLESFYTLRTLLPEFYTNRDPFSPEIQEVLSLGSFIPLPKTADPSSPRIVLVRNGLDDPDKITPINAIKTNLMSLDVLSFEDDTSIIAGQHVLQDFEAFSVTHMLRTTPAFAKKVTTCVQNGYPSRPKGVHFINIPSFFETMYTMVKPFINEKMKSRMKIYTQDNYDELYKVIPQSLLPMEYGGDAGSLESLAAEWKKKVESYRDWFREDEKYRTDETKRQGKPKTAGEVFGLEGSFRKLDVD